MNREQAHIGCIDGKTIALRRQGDEFVLCFDRAEARLSKEAAIRLANLLTTSPRIIQKTKERRTYSTIQRLPRRTSKAKETLADLLEEGILGVGSVLIMSHQGKDYYAKITSQGALDLDGHIELTPSDASKWVTGQESDGWQVWSIRNGERLAHLRWRLRAVRFLGDNHGYSSKYIREIRRITKGWVDYALEKDLNPRTRTKADIENYLTHRQIKMAYSYAEGTLNAYRGHLHVWFERCKTNNW